jgi:hypothetical protein
MQLSAVLTLVRAVADRLAVALAVGLVVGISACGGGGGGGPPNPVLGTLAFTTNENVGLSGTLTAKDPGAVTFSQTTSPTSGTVSVTGDGKFIYTPNPNFTGSDSFGVLATDAAGNKTTGTVTVTVTVNQPPTAGSVIVRSDSGANIKVLDAAKDPDKDNLTVTITTLSNVGTATVNSDGTVSITGLGGFKGLARFGYTVTDPSGATATANAAIFVGVDPFRAVFVADSAANGSYEVYLTDFAASPTQVTKATQGSVRLKGFAASDNGATVVYRTEDAAGASTASLFFVRTATPATQVSIPLPSGALPAPDAQGRDQFVVSPDGNWIAMIAGQGNANSLYVLNVTNPTVVTQVVPMIAGVAGVYATQPTFTSDSKNVYFLASRVTGGANKTLYVAALGNQGASTQVSGLSVPATSDEITAYSVAPNQSTIVEQANRAGRVGLFSIDPAKLQTEIQINTTPDPGTAITTSTVGIAPGLGGSNTGTKVAYDVGVPGSSPDAVGIYVAGVPPVASPAPQFVALLEQLIGFSPDDSKLLYTDHSQVFEIAGAAGNTGTQLGIGNQGWYDSTGNVVLIQNTLSAGVSLSYNARPFGSPKPVTPTGTAAFDVDVSGFGRGVVIFCQAPASGTAPATAKLQLVSPLSPVPPATPIPLTSSASPLNLTSYVSKVVTN